MWFTVSFVIVTFPLTFRSKVSSPCNLVTLVQRYAFSKSEVYAAFQFRENRRHGTDGQTDG